MKQIQRLIKLSVIFCLFFQESNAQQIPKDIVERCYNTPYIFEGKVICSTPYWNTDHKFIYTSNIVEVYKIFKGDMECGSYEIITQGGTVPAPAGSTAITVADNIVLTKNMEGIFFCTFTDYELPPDNFCQATKDLKFQITYNDQGLIKYFDDYANYQVSDWQFQLDSLAQVYNLLDLLAQLNYVNCSGKGPGVISERKQIEETKLATPHNPHKQFPRSTKIKVEGTSRFAGVDTSIYYDIINPQIVETYPQRRFDFDVALSDQITGIYLWTAAFLIEYDTAIFGTNVWANGHIEVTPAGISALPSYGDPSAYLNDVGGFDNIVAFEIYPDGGGPFIYDLPTSPAVAAHVSMLMNRCDTIGNVYLDDPETYSPARFDTSHDGTSLPFYYTNAILQTGAMTVPECDMHINSISPLQVNGGVGDTVTITGFNFLDAPGQNGNIFVKDAVQGGQYYLRLEYMDLALWTDTLIKFVMPSYIDSINTLALNNHYGVPGSGVLKLYNDLGDSAIGDSVTVFYSVTNRKDHPVMITHKYVNKLINNAVSPTGGYVFHPDTSVSNHDSIMMCVERAILEWNCQTNVNFQLGDSIIYSGLPGAYDSVNTVIVADLDTGVLAQTFTNTFASACERAYVREIDIVINKKYLPVFWCDTSACDTVPIGKKDLFATLLHEIGHAHQLNHINDTTRIMWWLARRPNGAGTVLPWDRPIYLYLDTPADSGGARVMVESSELFLQDSCYKTLMTPYIPNDCMPHIPPPHDDGDGTQSVQSVGCWPHPYVQEINKPDIQLNAFPNPVRGDLTIQYENLQNGDVSLKICDYIGREVFVANKNKRVRGRQEIRYDTSNLSDGLYVVTVEVGGYKYFLKFIKE